MKSQIKALAKQYKDEISFIVMIPGTLIAFGFLIYFMAAFTKWLIYFWNQGVLLP